MYLIHYTSANAYASIKISRRLLIQKERERLGLKFSHEGVLGRRFGPNDISLSEQRADKYDEGIGVYFRISATIPILTEKQRKRNIVILVFSDTILQNYPGWFINTTENNGFKLGPKVVESPISGEYGKTVYDTRNDAITPDDSELIIPESVDLRDILTVVT
jgi:hypothetical protein